MHQLKLIVLSCLLFIGGGFSPAVPSKEHLRKLYEENLRMQTRTAQLDNALAGLSSQIEATKKAIGNLQYVESENAKSMTKITGAKE